MKIINAATDNHYKQMERLAEFLELDSVEYIDHGENEEYILKKNGKSLTIKAAYNKVDGGFLVVSQ